MHTLEAQAERILTAAELRAASRPGGESPWRIIQMVLSPASPNDKKTQLRFITSEKGKRCRNPAGGSTEATRRVASMAAPDGDWSRLYHPRGSLRRIGIDSPSADPGMFDRLLRASSGSVRNSR